MHVGQGLIWVIYHTEEVGFFGNIAIRRFYRLHLKPYSRVSDQRVIGPSSVERLQNRLKIDWVTWIKNLRQDWALNALNAFLIFKPDVTI